MPYYEYLCADCSTKFELRRLMKEIDTPAICPVCKGIHTARQVSRVMAFSHDDSGSVSALGSGGGCAGCSSTSCGTCASRN